MNSYRADYGAVQSRLEHALSSTENYVENVAAVQSRILDADFAYETSQLAKQNIMTQAGIAALVQAKNVNQSVVALLG